MKKSVKILSLLIAIILMSGCSGNNKEFVKTCTLTSTDSTNGYKLESEYKVYGKGKIVNKVVTVETVTSDDEEIIEYFEENLKKSYESANETYGGYTNKVTKTDGKVISETTIDYNKMDLEQYVKDNSIMNNFVDKNNKMLADGVISLYETMGATCK